jgi:hypothetical protein
VFILQELKGVYFVTDLQVFIPGDLSWLGIRTNFDGAEQNQLPAKID